MNLDLTEDQTIMRDSFARFLGEHSSMARVRAALPSGFDPALWKGLAELGAFSIRTPEDAGGAGLGVFDACILMEEAGRTLASGPIAEAILAAQLLARLGGRDQHKLLQKVLAGEVLITLAYHDLAEAPVQWVAGGAVAQFVIGLDGDRVVLITPPAGARGEPNLASTPIAELDLATADRTVIAAGPEARQAFGQAIEEWKLMMAAALAGLARRAIEMAAAYAGERKAFGQYIGTFQAISHPLAVLITHTDASKYFTWKTLHDVADGQPRAGAQISLALWWAADTAARAVCQSLQTFGGYGLTLEYDIHLYNLRAKAWPLAFGDPERLLDEGGRRLYGGEGVALPDVGAVPIDFDRGEEARGLAAEVDAFFQKHLTPELKAKAHFSWEGYDAGLHRKFAEAGLLFPDFPRELGGREASPYAVAAAYDVWEDHEWSTSAPLVTRMIAWIIHLFGSDELKRNALGKIVAGKALCSLGYSEPGAGSDVFAAQTRATREGDGWRIDGQKMFTSGADLSDYILLIARTNPDAPKHKGLTMFLVPVKSPGLEVQPVHTFQDEQTNITYYDGVRIPDSHRLGEVDGGVRVMAAALDLEHNTGYAKTLERLLRAGEQLCREIVRERQPLIEDPSARRRLARIFTQSQLAKVLNERMLWASVEEKPAPAWGPMTRVQSAEAFLDGARDLLDLAAPLSLAKRSGPVAFISQCYRHGSAARIYGGTQEIHRSMIAERNLGLPRTRG